MTSRISSTVRPLRSAARRCIASSSWWPCAMSEVSTATDRDRRSRPGRDQMSPQATRVMKSWKSAVSIGRAGDRAVDVRVRQHFAAHLSCPAS